MLKSILIAGIVAISMIATAPAFAHMGGGEHHMGGGGPHMGGHHEHHGHGHGGFDGGFDGGYDDGGYDGGYVDPRCVWLPVVGYSTCPYNND